jgi:membrane peptidoglycan carboxypeptidase
MLTMRRGLENSINLVTAHLLADGINDDPEKSLAQVCATALAAKIYKECIRYYPFVLGAQPVRMIDLAAFYAAVANEGALPKAHAIDSIEVDGKMVFQYPNAPLPFIGAADRTSFYQLKTVLQGVVARGTARAIGDLSPFVAGKTGTTEDAVDGWFIGFTNDVTVAVWVGYDNSDGKRRSLGSRQAAPVWRCRSSSRSCKRSGRWRSRLRRRSTGHRRRPSVIWSICRSITRMEADARGAAVKASSSISELGPMARLKRPNISSRHVRRLPDHARQSRAKISSKFLRCGVHPNEAFLELRSACPATDLY